MLSVVTPPMIENLYTSWAPADRMWYQDLSGNSAIKYTVPNAPKGMAYNAAGGYLTWTPTQSQVGSYSLTAVPTNSVSAYTYDFTVVVSPDVPSMSYTTGNSDGTGLVGVPTTIQINDGAATPGAFSILSGPKGVAINSKTGLINWTPAAADAGNVAIVVQSKNPYGSAKITVPMKIYVAPAVTNITVKTNGLAAPTMSWTQPTFKGEAITGYNIVLNAYGPNGVTTYAYNRDSAATSYQLYGLPQGNYGFVATVTPIDAAGHKGLPTTGPVFKYAAIAPKITVSTTDLSVKPLNPLTFAITQGDGATYSVIAAPSGLTCGEDGTVTWTPTENQVGTYAVKFSSTSQWGTATALVQIVVQPPVPPPPSSEWVSNVSSTGVTISWKPPAETKWITSYKITFKYSDDTSTAFGNPNLTSTFNVPANVFTYHFTTPKLGAFAIQVASVNALGDEGAKDDWVSVGNTIYDPLV